MKFYNRESELEILNRILMQSEKGACFTAVVGRRRIGKTALLMQSVQSVRYLYLFVSRKSEQLLCAQFQKEAEEAIGLQIFGKISDFRTLFEQLLMYAVNNPYTLIIDEFQELERVNKSIFSEMQDLWDRYRDSSRVNLIACGSVWSMMKKIFENEKEPLFGRVDSKMRVRPFSVKTIREILSDYYPDYQPEDLLCLYMITGGVAKYIALLMEAGAFTKDQMIDYVVRADSPFLSEGKDLLISEFGRDYGTYFSIIQLIAGGKTSQGEIDSVICKNTGTYLANLEEEYSLVKKNKPMFSKPEGRNIRWSLNDNFLLFWFRFIYPNQQLIELGRNGKLKEYILQNYDQFSGLILERYFYDKISQEEDYTQIGAFWDKKGQNEMDIIAVDSLRKTAIVAEVKRNRDKISLSTLKDKALCIKKELMGYEVSFRGLSMEEM